MLDNDGHDFLFENKGAVIQLCNVDGHIGDVGRDIYHAAEIDSGSLLNIPQVLARLQATGR